MIKPSNYISNLTDDIVSSAYSDSNVVALIKYGSQADGSFDILSDLDLFVITSDIKTLHSKILEQKPLHFLSFETRNVYYFQNTNPDIRKVDLSYSDRIEDIEKYMKAGENLSDLIIFDKSNKYSEFQLKKTEKPVIEKIRYHVNRFVESFENASVANQSADRYRFLFYQNICLQHLYTLEYIQHSNTEFDYLPKRLLQNISPDSQELLIHKFDPNSQLREGHTTRQHLVDLFLKIMSKYSDEYSKELQLEVVKTFLFAILDRDKIWNLRDISDIDSDKIKTKQILRASTLSKYPENILLWTLQKYEIASILDLRYSEEIERYPYHNLPIEYRNVPVGEKHVNPHQLKYTTIGVDPFFYEYFPRHYHDEIYSIFRQIIELPKPVLIHCHAGKDRTGIIVAMLQKLVGLFDDEIIRDYLSSRSDTREEKIKVTLTLIEEFGGIRDYLRKVGLSENEILELEALLSLN